jgi:hypothetical protein
MQKQKADGTLPPHIVLTANAARRFSGFVQATPAHHQHCPYCKCFEHKKDYSRRGAIDPDTLTLAKDCQGMKKRK